MFPSLIFDVSIEHALALETSKIDPCELSEHNFNEYKQLIKFQEKQEINFKTNHSNIYQPKFSEKICRSTSYHIFSSKLKFR